MAPHDAPGLPVPVKPPETHLASTNGKKEVLHQDEARHRVHARVEEIVLRQRQGGIKAGCCPARRTLNLSRPSSTKGVRAAIRLRVGASLRFGDPGSHKVGEPARVREVVRVRVAQLADPRDVDEHRV